MQKTFKKYTTAYFACVMGIATSVVALSGFAYQADAAQIVDVKSVGPVATQAESLQSKDMAPGTRSDANKHQHVVKAATREQQEKQAQLQLMYDAYKIDPVAHADLLLAQTHSDGCTLTSNAMMLRRAAYMDGSSDWSAIDDASLGSIVWGGAGIPNTYEAFGKTVNYHSLESGADGRKQELIDLLAQHPEGLAMYDPGVPHAVLLICYDQADDRFLCADPTPYYAGNVIEVGESWNGCVRGSSDAVINGFSNYWSIDA